MSASIAVVLPCYNPAPGWVERLVTRFEAFAAGYPAGQVHLTLVHDGTPGGLAPAALAELRARLPRMQFLDATVNRGKGFALRRGMAAAPAGADVYLYTDIDLPYTLDSMRRVVAHVRARGGVAAGERFEDYYDGVPAFRRYLSKAHRLLMRTAFRLPVSDSQAGLKAFDAAGRAVFLETTTDRFLVDLDFIARSRGRVEVAPVRVELRPDVQFTDFGLSILRAEAGNFVRILREAWLR